jgi:signal transduction histidine kinase
MQTAPVLVASLAAGCALAPVLMVLWPWRRRRAAIRRRAEIARAESAALRKRLAEVERRERMLTEEIRHLATTRLPALARALRHTHIRVPGPRHQLLGDSDVGRALASVLTSASAALMSERRRVDGAAQAAMRGATTKLQTMCYQVQTTVDEMLHKYDDPDLAERLAGLDYLNEQILRRLQVTRVVCGAGAGLVRTRSPLRGLVLGASSRIPSYERVQIVDHLPEPVAVVDRAAEPVAIVIAELLANAVHHSHGTLPVEVSLHQAHNGAVVVINDAGIGMNTEEFGKARRMLAGTDEVFLAELGDPPRSGFAAVGRLCRQYGLSVSLEPSHYAGIKAVVFIPAELLTTLDPEDQPPVPAPVGRPAPNPAAPAQLTPPPEPGPAPGAGGWPDPAPAGGEPPLADGVLDTAAPAGPPEADGPAIPGPALGDGVPPLPQRRHRRAARASPESDAGAFTRGTLPRDPSETAARMGALQRGTALGRRAVAQDDHAPRGPQHEQRQEREQDHSPKDNR